MNPKHQQNLFHVTVEENLMLENVIQIKRGITINVAVSAKIQ